MRTAEQEQAWIDLLPAQCAFLRAHGWDHQGSGLWSPPEDPNMFDWDVDHAVLEQNLRCVYGQKETSRRAERRHNAQINRDRWVALGLNGGRHMTGDEDRENFLLNEHERLSGLLRDAGVWPKRGAIDLPA